MAPAEADERNEKFLFGFMIASFVFTGIVWLLAIALRKRIMLSATIFQEAAQALGRLPSVCAPPPPFFLRYTDFEEAICLSSLLLSLLAMKV